MGKLRKKIKHFLKWLIWPMVSYKLKTRLSILKGKRCLVLGSAPSPTLPDPKDYDVLVCSNGSAIVAHDLGLQKPTASVLHRRVIENPTESRRLIREKIGQCESIGLVVLCKKGGKHTPSSVAQALNVRFDGLFNLSASHSEHLLRSVSGVKGLERGQGVSVGALTVAMAVHCGAKSVLVSGISFKGGGDAYSDKVFQRPHVSNDIAFFALMRIIRKCIIPLEEDLKLIMGQAGTDAPSA